MVVGSGVLGCRWDSVGGARFMLGSCSVYAGWCIPGFVLLYRARIIHLRDIDEENYDHT